MQLCKQTTYVIGTGGYVTGGFEACALDSVPVDDAMAAVEQGIEQLQFYPGAIERRQDIDLCLGDQVLQFFFRRIGDKTGMGLLIDEAGEFGRRVFP